MLELTKSPLFGIALSILAFYAGMRLRRVLRTELCNPLMLGTFLVIGVLVIFGIPVENFNVGGDIILMFLPAATAALAIHIYRQFPLIRSYWLPILAGTGVGALTSVTCVWGLCKWLLPDAIDLTASLLPKSVTSPIAVELSKQYGGLPAITVTAVVITGIFGAVAAPWLIRLFGIKNPIAAGVGIGTSSHAAGTTKAQELGETQCAMSGISIGIAGLYTVLYLLLLNHLR